MMKFSKLTLAQAIGSVLAITAASQSSALDVSTYNEATQVTLRIGGATAVRPGLINLFKINDLNNGICANNTLDIYQSTDGLKYLALCTGRVGGANPLPAALQGTRIAVLKSDDGGSGNGVGPLVRPSLGAALPDFWNIPAGGGFLAACAGVTQTPASSSFSTYVLHTGCSNANTQDRVPDAGVSDLEPAIFRSAFVPPLNPTELAAIPGVSISAVAFGIPVTLNVRDNMQRIQFDPSSVCHPDNAGYAAADETEACMPSLTKGQVAGLYTQNYPDWNFLVGNGGETVAAPTGGNVLANAGEAYVCRRVNTSGTQASYETQLLAQRCVAGVPGFATTGSDIYAPVQHVFESSGSSGVVSCMTARNNAGQGAIGTLSLEFVPNTSRTAGVDSGFRFLKLNGAAPCLLNYIQSKYDFISESTMQWRTAAIAGQPALAGLPLTLATAIRTRIGLPAIVNDLNGSFSHPFCASLGSGALLGNALSNAAGAPVPPFVVGGGSASDVVARPILTKTRGVSGPNSCGPFIDVLPTQQTN